MFVIVFFAIAFFTVKVFFVHILNAQKSQKFSTASTVICGATFEFGFVCIFVNDAFQKIWKCYESYPVFFMAIKEVELLIFFFHSYSVHY